MTQSPGVLLTVLAFLGVIGPLVFLHELGHYLAGRLFGVKAEVFAIGFGRELFGLTDRRGTRWTFGWLPLGGYVRFAGDLNAGSEPDPAWLALPAEERAQTFQAKPLWQRAIIVAAGPVANFIVAVLILAAFAMLVGVNRTPPVAGTVQPGSAAASAGIRAGDRIRAVDGRAVDDFGDIAEYVVARPAMPIRFDIESDGRTRTVTAIPAVQYKADRFGNRYAFGRMGITSPTPVVERVSLAEAPGVAVGQTIGIMRTMVDGIGQIVTGLRPVSELGGPLRIAQFSGEAASAGLTSLAYLIALISINLGFINLLPVPMLDGGHLLFYAIEALRRKPVDAEVQQWAYRSGLVLLLSLMLFVTFNDLAAFGLWRGLAGLIG